MKFAEKVRSKGHQAELKQQVVPGLGTRHQVCTGMFDTYNEAQVTLKRLEKDLNVAGITGPAEVADKPWKELRISLLLTPFGADSLWDRRSMAGKFQPGHRHEATV